jgi:hypothetical protein
MVFTLGSASAQQIHRNSFESQEPAWIKGPADVPYQEVAHRLAEDWAHTGQKSEYIRLQAEQGNHIHYTYNVGKAPLGPDLNIGVWLRANRPGMQLMARLVLPNERNGDRLDEPLSTLLRGEIYDSVGRWKPLRLKDAPKLAKDQQQLLRAQLNRDVNMKDAYVDRIVLNVYGGPGLTEVWIDDLEVGPVADPSVFKSAARAADRGAPAAKLVPGRTDLARLNRERLFVGDRRFFFRAIRRSDTPLKALRSAGFNTVWLDSTTSQADVDEAVGLGFWIVPALPLPSTQSQANAANVFARGLAQYRDQDGLLFWYLGDGGLAAEQAPAVGQAALAVRTADPQRPIAADVWDGFGPYGQSVGMLGVHRWPLMTGLELARYRDWLTQRRLLANPNTFTWTWVQTHLPDWYTTLVYGRPATAGFSEPIGPQPEQIQLLTYLAVASGCKGLGFWSDRFLADSHQGHDRLLGLALVNQELQMLEPLLVSALPPDWIDTSKPEVKAAKMATEFGTLVLPIWVGPGSQYVAGQGAVAKLSMIVPEVPVGTHAWEVTPAYVKALKCERVVGGTQVTLPEFGLTAAILFTTDNGPQGLLARLQEQTRRHRKLAAQWAHDLAEAELAKVLAVEAELERDNHVLPDGPQLIADARRRLQVAEEHWKNGDFPEAYNEAQRALRPLRILMRGQWESATKDLDTPVASPYAVSFYTLPAQWRFMEQVRSGLAGANVLPDGGFEPVSSQAAPTWQAQEVTLDEVEMSARRVAEAPQEGRQCLMLQIKPKNPALAPRALERTFLAVHSPEVRLQPGTLVRVSAWVKIPKQLEATSDGALLYDSAGGEPLALRVLVAPKWRKYTLYRQVPASGTLHLTLALTGIGTVYFDDVRIEPFQGPTTSPPRATLSPPPGSGPSAPASQPNR